MRVARVGLETPDDGGKARRQCREEFLGRPRGAGGAGAHAGGRGVPIGARDDAGVEQRNTFEVSESRAERRARIGRDQAALQARAGELPNCIGFLEPAGIHGGETADDVVVAVAGDGARGIGLHNQAVARNRLRIEVGIHTDETAEEVAGRVARHRAGREDLIEISGVDADEAAGDAGGAADIDVAPRVGLNDAADIGSQETARHGERRVHRGDVAGRVRAVDDSFVAAGEAADEDVAVVAGHGPGRVGGGDRACVHADQAARDVIVCPRHGRGHGASRVRARDRAVVHAHQPAGDMKALRAA